MDYDECAFRPCEHGSYCEWHDHHTVTDPFGQPFGHSLQGEDGDLTALL